MVRPCGDQFHVPGFSLAVAFQEHERFEQGLVLPQTQHLWHRGDFLAVPQISALDTQSNDPFWKLISCHSANLSTQDPQREELVGTCSHCL